MTLHRRQASNRGEVGLHDLLVLLFMMLAMLLGSLAGGQFGSQ
ncbi:MAG TPA: hypothetical protein PK867_10765 [Pirellulales bacterium]|nr:hypothetical protein [Pirellulales bacterium]